jgi:hypothetical protein
MNINSSTDWTTPEAYLRGVTPVPRWRRALQQLDRLIAEMRLASRLRREVRALRHLRWATRDMPAYLRRDIGLDP